MDQERETARMEEDVISLVEVGSVLLRHRVLIVRSGVAVTLLAVLFALRTPLSYTANTSFLPQAGSGGGSGIGGLAGLAGQFGIAVPSGALGESPEFYAEIVRSREILEVLATEEFSLDDGEVEDTARQSGTLADILEIGTEEQDAALRRQGTIDWLRAAVSVTTGKQTQVVSISVKTPQASLSEALASRLLALLNDFNLRTRQSQAAAERAFIETRLAEVQDSLRAAEDRLERFLESNRQWAGSPELTFQRDRIQRQVVMQQQVFTSLAEAHEQARIAEVRNTPVITVVERPVRPVRPDPRGRIMKAAVGVVLGGMLGVLLAFGREYSHRARAREGAEYQEFSTLWQQTRADVRSLGRLRRS